MFDSKELKKIKNNGTIFTAFFAIFHFACSFSAWLYFFVALYLNHSPKVQRWGMEKNWQKIYVYKNIESREKSKKIVDDFK